MTEMISRELTFPPRGVAKQRGRHDSGAQDQEIERATALLKAGREGCDRQWVEKVHRGDFDVWHIVENLPGRARIACRHDNMSAFQSEYLDRLKAQIRCAARDDRGLPCKIDAIGDISGGRERAEGRIKRQLHSSHGEFLFDRGRRAAIAPAGKMSVENE